MTLYPLLVFIALGCFALSILLVTRVSVIAARVAQTLGTALCGLLVGLLVVTMHRLPLFGAFEALTYTVFVMGLLELLPNPLQSKSARQTMLMGIMATLFLAPLLVCSDTMPQPNFFTYGNPLVVCFFFGRLTATGLLAYAGIAWLTAATAGKRMRLRRENTIRGRNFLLLGSVIFLVSECAGSMWCFAGWGDSWRWSGNFFRSAMFFLLIMLGLHLPTRWKSHAHRLSLIGSCTSLFIVACVLIRQIIA